MRRRVFGRGGEGGLGADGERGAVIQPGRVPRTSGRASQCSRSRSFMSSRNPRCAHRVVEGRRGSLDHLARGALACGAATPRVEEVVSKRFGDSKTGAATDHRVGILRVEAWVDGVAHPMSGGTPAHSRLAAQMIGEPSRVIGDGPGGVHSSDQKVRPRKIRFASYPDVVVVCGEVETHAGDPNAVLNPTVLVEVLSDSTEDWDRGGKFVRYRKLTTLRDYVLVSQQERNIEVRSRRDDGVWEMREAGEGETIPLASFAEPLSVDHVYRGVTLTTAPTGEHGAA